MIKRLAKPLTTNSFFLFGARGTGKTTFLKEEILTKKSLYVNLLLAEEFNNFRLNPDYLTERLDLLGNDVDWVVIDEIQKVPALLDVVHNLIEERESNLPLLVRVQESLNGVRRISSPGGLL